MQVDPALAVLLTPEGRALVDSLTPYDAESALKRLAAVRKDPQWVRLPDVVAAAATQARLRTRAVGRFPGDPRWWTADGLEQATRPDVAGRHAQRFAASGIDAVADLGCGAGSDALALAERGIAVHAVDLDPEALWALEATAADRGLSVSTEHGDVTAEHWWWNAGHGSVAERKGGPAPGCFVDPARRRDGRRLLDPQLWSPPWSWVCDLASRVPATGAKVAPGIDHTALPADCEAEWVSVGGDLVECGVWWGPLRQGPGRRVATVDTHPDPPDSEELPPVTWAQMDDAAGVPAPEVGPVGAWLVEPDAAVIRAGLVSVLAEGIGGRLLDPHIAYVVTDTAPPPTPFGDVFEVVEVVPFARKRLRAHLRSAGYGDVVVKKRGIAVVPELLRADLRLAGDGPTATLVLTRTRSGPLALVVRRAEQGDQRDC